MDKILENDYNCKKHYIINIKIKNFMSAYLAYSYSTRLTKKEEIKIDQKTKNLDKN